MTTTTHGGPRTPRGDPARSAGRQHLRPIRRAYVAGDMVTIIDPESHFTGREGIIAAVEAAALPGCLRYLVGLEATDSITYVPFGPAQIALTKGDPA